MKQFAIILLAISLTGFKNYPISIKHYEIEPKYIEQLMVIREIAGDFHYIPKTKSYEEIQEYVEYYCEEFPNITPQIIYGIMRKESAFQSDAVSYANCIGLGQLNPKYQDRRIKYLSNQGYFEYHEDWTVEDYLFDPYINTCITCYYWSCLLATYDFDTACKVYNLGGGNLDNEYLVSRCEEIYIVKVYEYMNYYAIKYEDEEVAESVVEETLEEQVLEEMLIETADEQTFIYEEHEEPD